MNRKENNGIYGYGQSRRKKVKDELYGLQAADAGVDAFPDEAREQVDESIERIGEYMNKEVERLASPIDTAKREKEYLASARNYLVPEDNELRRRRVFVTSNRGVSEATNDYYKNSVKGVFDSERATATADAMAEYKKYVSVPGADPVVASGAMRRAADPAKVVGRTMQKIDKQPLDSVAESYARYAQLSPEKYRSNVLEPEIRERLYDEYIDEATPKSSLEYIARSAVDNSLTGKMVNYGLDGYAQTNTQREIDKRGLERYNAGRMENLAAGIGSLAIDMPAFSAIGGVSSKLVSGAGEGVAKGLSKVLANKYAARGMQLPEAERIVERAIVGKMSSKIAQSMGQQGLTLGGYDAANSMADDLLSNDGIDVGKAVDAYAHGFGTGALLGLVGTPLREAARGLTGGKKMVASAGVLGAESAVFTVGSTLQQADAGVDIEPIDVLYNFGESAATLGAMRLAHWRPKGAYAKLNSKGVLKEGFRFTSSEAEEIENAGVNPRLFMSEIERTLNPNNRLSERGLQNVKDKYLHLMSNEELSMSTRSKLLYLVENKISSSSPLAVDYDVKRGVDDSFRVSLLDANGRRIAVKKFTTPAEVDNFLESNGGELRKNKIANYEKMLFGKYDAENFFRKAGEFAEEQGVGVDIISEVMYKKANGAQLSTAENNMLSEISSRAAQGDKNVGYMLRDIRRRLERNYNLEEGALLRAIDKKTYDCTAVENRALDDYASIIRNEVEAINKGGFSKNNTQGTAGSKSDAYNPYASNIKVPQEWNAPYAWSVAGAKNSIEDMRHYQRRADELAQKLGYKLDYLYDERDISYSENPTEYENKLYSAGWTDRRNGKVYINLPNIKNMNELEKTVVHEIVGHEGLPRLFGNHIFEFYDDLYKRVDSNVKAEIDNIKINENYSNGYMAMEEYLARLAEKTTPTQKERTILTRVKDYLKGMFTRMGLYPYGKEKVSSQELIRLLTAHHESMMNRVNPQDYRATVFGRFPSARHSSGYYNVEGNGNLSSSSNAYRFIGEKGAKNLAEDSPIDYGKMANLYFETAKEMERRGRGAKEIWQKTGWARGADDKWRSEIPDYTLRLNDFFLSHLRRKDPILANTYESIVKTPVSQRYKSDNALLKRILKENRAYLKDIKVRDLVYDNELFTAYPELGGMPVVVSRNMKEPSFYNSREGKLYVNENYLTNLPELKEHIIMPIQQMIQHYEGFERGVNLLKADARNYFKEDYDLAKKVVESLMSKKSYDGFEKLKSQMRKGFIKTFGVSPDDFNKNYPTLEDYMYSKVFKRNGDFAGNVELRNVYNRQWLSDEERARILPSQSEDVPRENQFPLDFKKMHETLSGPLDIIYNKIKKENTDGPLVITKEMKHLATDGQTPYEKLFAKEIMRDFKDILQDNIRKMKKEYNLDKDAPVEDLYDMLSSEVDKVEQDMIRKIEMREPKITFSSYPTLFNIPGYKIIEKPKDIIFDPYYGYVDRRKVLEKYMKPVDEDINEYEEPELLN